MNSLFIPEKNNQILRYYHKSSKLLIPGIVLASCFHYSDQKKLSKYTNYLNTLNFGFHSYVSLSCIITDYIKPKNLSRLVRGGNLTSHLFAITGYFYYLQKNY